MSLLLLTFITVFIGGISFFSTSNASRRTAWKSNYLSVFPKRSFSLWSLILFLLFPKLNQLSAPKPVSLNAGGNLHWRCHGK